MKKFLTALILCGALSLSSNFAYAAESDLQLDADFAESQDLDFWSRLRDNVFFGDEDRHHRHEPPPHYRDDRHHAPPPHFDDRGRHHEPPPPPPKHHRPPR